MERGVNIEKAIQVMVVHKVCILGGNPGPPTIIVPLLSVLRLARPFDVAFKRALFAQHWKGDRIHDRLFIQNFGLQCCLQMSLDMHLQMT